MSQLDTIESELSEDDLSDSSEARLVKRRKLEKPWIDQADTTGPTPSTSADTEATPSTSAIRAGATPSTSNPREEWSSSQHSQVKKQSSRVQHFSEKWLSDPKLKGWIQVAEHDNTYAKCNACVINLKAKYSDLIHHANSNRHKKSVKNLKSSMKVDTLLKEKIIKNQEHIDVVCANLRSALLVAEHNLSFSVIDHITKVNKANYKDSKIAASVQLSRTKCTMIIKNVLANFVTDELKQQIQGKKISLLLDEATDVSNKKLLCILIKFIYGNDVKTQVLGLKEVDSDHGTAKGLYALLKQSLTEFNIEEKNVVGYCADNASVMMGSKESVKKYLLSANPHLVSNGCICHTIHLIAVSAASCLPDKLENLLQNISTYFSRSPKRQSVLETFQEFMNNEKVKVLKPSATRWLALSKCVDRILEMWDVLTELFRLADFEGESEVAKIIFNDISNPMTKAYLLFLKYILPTFNQFNAFFQSEKLLTTSIYSECLRFLKLLGSNFLKKEYITDEIVNINSLHPHYLLPVEDIQVGSSTSILIASFDKNLKKQFLLKCVSFYQRAFQECQSRFPLNNFFKNLNFIQRDIVFNSNFITDIQCVAAKISPDKVDECTKEYRQLQLYFSDDEKSTLPTNTIQFWKYISTIKNFNDEFLFKNIAELALTVLCIPHGNADVERVFSSITDIKTKKRNRLSTSVLEAVLRIKQDLHYNKMCCHNYKFKDEHFKKYNISMYSFKE